MQEQTVPPMTIVQKRAGVAYLALSLLYLFSNVYQGLSVRIRHHWCQLTGLVGAG